MKLLLIALMTLGAHTLFAQENPGVEPYLSPRELLVVKAGTDKIWGTSVVAVIYRGTTPKEFSFRLNLPKETVDFQVAEGLDPKDVTLGDGGLFVKKIFAPGVQVVSVAFAAPAKNGVSELTLHLMRDLPELIVMTPAQMLEIRSQHLQARGVDQQDGQSYQVFGLDKPLQKGQTMSVIVGGVPEGRDQLWVLGGILGFVLTVSAGFFAWRNRKELAMRSNEDSF